MERKLQGQYTVISTAGEKVRAFIPASLPPNPPIHWSPELREKFDQALLWLGRLDSVSVLLPDTSLFLYMYVRKEAVLSSMIEGTQSSLSDLLLFELDHQPGVPLDDVQEVSNYVAALDHGLSRLKGGFPLSLRLFREIHEVLLSKGRGSDRMPGEFRRSQRKNPCLYLSLYFKTHRQKYYELLNIVRLTGDWEIWLAFFADAAADTAAQAVDTAQRLMTLTSEDGDRINELGRVAGSVHRVHRSLLERPIASSNWLQEKTLLSFATVNTCLKQLGKIGIVRELTGRKRNRLYAYSQYIEIMNQGAELPNQ